ncbi:MAG TPA: DinB family protein [Bryobacteraceae bacterium]|nr:DinB family protein [Bryobacteraceae bacterium]
MAFKDAILPEFDHEMANTRKTLERVPGDKLGWTPHPKSNNMGWLAAHVAGLPGWVTMVLENDSFNLAPAGPPPPRTQPVESTAQALETFDKNVAAARRAIESVDDRQMLQPWSLLAGEQTIFTMPRMAVLRSVVMNHLIHHRGQLTVYLRLNDVPVPALYGPSADEPM